MHDLEAKPRSIVGVNLKMPNAFVRQFSRPRGLLGRLAGLIMANRPSNLERNMRTLALVNIQPDDRVLEIGFGPGIAIERAAELAKRGKVIGVDHSALMLRQASRRNATAIAAGRVELRLGTAEKLPEFSDASIRSSPSTPTCSGRIPKLLSSDFAAA